MVTVILECIPIENFSGLSWLNSCKYGLRVQAR